MTGDWLPLVLWFVAGVVIGSLLSPTYHWIAASVARRRVLVMDYDNPCGSDCLIQRQSYTPTDVEVQKLLHDLDEAVAAGKHSNPRLAASSK